MYYWTVYCFWFFCLRFLLYHQVGISEAGIDDAVQKLIARGYACLLDYLFYLENQERLVFKLSFASWVSSFTLGFLTFHILFFKRQLMRMPFINSYLGFGSLDLVYLPPCIYTLFLRLLLVNGYNFVSLNFWVLCLLKFTCTCFVDHMNAYFERYKVGRMEQTETSDQAKARGANSVSILGIPAVLLNLVNILLLFYWWCGTREIMGRIVRIQGIGKGGEEVH